MLSPEEKILQSQENLVDSLNLLDEYNREPELDKKQSLVQKIEDSVRLMKENLKAAEDKLTSQQEISEAESYNFFVEIFGKEEADSLWLSREWDEKYVLRDLVIVLMTEPDLRQKIEAKGFNLNEILNTLNQTLSQKACSFLQTARSLQLDGPPDWSVKVDQQLYGVENSVSEVKMLEV